MAKGRSSPRRKTMTRWILALCGLCIGLVLLFIVYQILSPGIPRPSRAPQRFPDTEIIYNAGEMLGFVNADGTGASTLSFVPATPDPMGFRVWGQPLITADDRYLIITYGAFPIGIGDIYVAAAGQFASLCSQWQVGSVRLAADSQHLLFDASADEEGLERYSPDDCGSDHPPAQVYAGINGVLSPDERYVAEVRAGSDPPYYETTIVLRQLDREGEEAVGLGNYPAWSLDSQWLAYTGSDGIYVIDLAAGAPPRRVIALQNPDPTGNVPLDHLNERSWGFFPPAVSWSPDGQWLVYHMRKDGLGERSGFSAQDYSIFRVNVFTGETVKIIEGGLTPYWRWPASP